MSYKDEGWISTIMDGLPPIGEVVEVVCGSTIMPLLTRATYEGPDDEGFQAWRAAICKSRLYHVYWWRPIKKS